MARARKSMSNTIKIPPVSIELNIGFNTGVLKTARDLDGNEVLLTSDGRWVFNPASYTTWRELRSFVRDYISPAVMHKENVMAVIPGVRDEYDDFESRFRLKLWFNSPIWEKLAQ